MKNLYIETERLTITAFDESMSESVHENSLDADVRRFVPDEVFETVEDARKAILFLMDCYNGNSGPFVYPVLTKSGGNIGYVQAVPTESGWEIGYHIVKGHTGNGYASEAVKSFLPVIMELLGIDKLIGVCALENFASRKVLQKCGFNLTEAICDYKGKPRTGCKYVYTKVNNE